MKIKIIICLVLLVASFSSCSICESLNGTQDIPFVEGDNMADIRDTEIQNGKLIPTLESIIGEWIITEFIGSQYITSNEEDENNVVGKTLLIGSDGIYYDGNITVIAPKLSITFVTYDYFIISYKIYSPSIGIDENKYYYSFAITDEESRNAVSLYQMNENECIYYRKEKFYRLIRNVAQN